MMRKRPGAVEFVAWVLALVSVYVMVKALWAYNPPDENSPVETVRHPDNTGAIEVGIFAILFFVSGVNIAKGRNWARWLYVATCLARLSLEVVFLKDPVKWYYVVSANICRALFLLLLFLPSSNEYFRAPEERRL
jgi:hypothetical protein